MFQINRLTPDAKAYFDNLPLYMQENIFMTSVDMQTKEDLENYMNNMQGETPS